MNPFSDIVKDSSNFLYSNGTSAESTSESETTSIKCLTARKNSDGYFSTVNSSLLPHPWPAEKLYYMPKNNIKVDRLKKFKSQKKSNKQMKSQKDHRKNRVKDYVKIFQEDTKEKSKTKNENERAMTNSQKVNKFQIAKKLFGKLHLRFLLAAFIIVYIFISICLNPLIMTLDYESKLTKLKSKPINIKTPQSTIPKDIKRKSKSKTVPVINKKNFKCNKQ